MFVVRASSHPPCLPAWVRRWLTLALTVVIASGLGGCHRKPAARAIAAPVASVRPAAVAGQFYPADPVALTGAVDGYLAGVKAPADPRPVIAVIVPHAGYEYCGKVAAQAYARVKGLHPQTVVIVGPSHRVAVSGAALCSAARWQTPLGEVPSDTELVAALARRDGFAINDPAHADEHSIEVQLPFLQRTLGQFRVVGVVMSDFSVGNCARVAWALASELKGRNVLLVASSDMSHFPAYADACKVDAQTLDALRSFDAAKVRATDARLLRAGTPNLDCTWCGLGAVVAVMQAAQRLGGDQVEVVRYANSGDAASGTRDRVVGYGAAVIYGKEGARMTDRAASDDSTPTAGELNEAQQRTLLRLARRTIQTYVSDHKLIDVNETDEALKQPRGVFVTLHRAGRLRGCIGDLEGRLPLDLNVRDKAIASATQDPRFEPVQPDEVRELVIEISVLSPMRRVEDAGEIVAGKHGVMVCQGRRAGVFLPQVATEQGWNREQMLNHLCYEKAGLAEDAWRHGAELYVFTAQVFGEERLGKQTDAGDGR